MSENTEIAVQPKQRRVTQLRHREVISRLLYHSQNVKQIAEELGFSERNLQAIIKTPLFQIELQKELDIKLRIERNNILQSVASSGTKKLLEAVEAGKMSFEERDADGNVVKKTEKVLDGREVVAIIFDSLDRTGHKPVTHNVNTSVDLGSLVMQAHKNAEKGGDDVIEVEVLETSNNEEGENGMERKESNSI